MKSLEQQLAYALNETTTSPAFAIFSGQPLAKAKVKPFYSSRVKIREALEDADISDLERVIAVAQDKLAQAKVQRERLLYIQEFTTKLYIQYQEYWFNKYETFSDFLVAFKGSTL